MAQKREKLDPRYGIMSSQQPLTKRRASHEHDSIRRKKRQEVVNCAEKKGRVNCKLFISFDNAEATDPNFQKGIDFMLDIIYNSEA
jgi:hypothetical protein